MYKGGDQERRSINLYYCFVVVVHYMHKQFVELLPSNFGFTKFIYKFHASTHEIAYGLLTFGDL